MAATGYESVIDFPVPQPRTTGTFLAVAEPLDDAVTTRNGVNRAWLGAKFIPWGCSDLFGANPQDCTSEEIGAGASLPEQVIQPAFSIHDVLQCSTLSTPGGELARRMAGRWRQWMSAAFARELLTADISGGHSLAGSATVINPGQPFSIVEAVGELENALALTVGNSVGIIHVPPRFIGQVVSKAGVQGDFASGFVTAAGHRVCFDAGYAVEVPPVGRPNSLYTMWMYGTGMVHYAASEPALLTADGVSSIDFARNIERRIEEAKGLLVFDPCAVFAIEVDVWGAVGS